MADMMIYVWLGAIVLFSIIFLFGLTIFVAIVSKYNNKAIILEPKSNGMRIAYGKYAKTRDKSGKPKWKLAPNMMQVFKPVSLPPIPDNYEIPAGKNNNICFFVKINQSMYVPQNGKTLTNEEYTEKVKEITKNKEFSQSEEFTKEIKESDTEIFNIEGKEYIKVKESNYMPLSMYVEDSRVLELSSNSVAADQWLSNNYNDVINAIDDKSFMEKYGHYVMWTATLVISMVVIIMTLDKVSEGLQVAKATSDTLFNTMKNNIMGV